MNKTLQRLQPTHVFTQSLCDICAVSAPLVRETCARIFPSISIENEEEKQDNKKDEDAPNNSPSCQIISLEPQSLVDVWETIRVAGRVVGVEEKAEQVVASCLEDLEIIRRAIELNREHHTQDRR